MKRINEDAPTNSTGANIAGINANDGDFKHKGKKITYKELLKRLSLKKE